MEAIESVGRHTRSRRLGATKKRAHCQSQIGFLLEYVLQQTAAIIIINETPLLAALSCQVSDKQATNYRLLRAYFEFQISLPARFCSGSLAGL